MPPPDPSDEPFRALPKVELHCHVDGAARPATLLELARRAGRALPGRSVEELLPFVRVSPACRSLDEFLLTFETFYPVLRQRGALGRIARELVEDMAADGVVHLEARFCPSLQSDGPGYTARDVLRETLEGLAEGAGATGISVGAIVCLYRILPADENARLVELALEHQGRGVVGLDLAGPESRPGTPFEASFARARDAGLPITVHAGEAAGPGSVHEALDRLHARRIGHGVAVARDPGLLRRIADAGVTLECCLTSNVQTGAVAGLAEHPFDALRRAGVPVTLSTDDPAVCGTMPSAEYALAARQWGLARADCARLVRTAASAAFLDAADRARLLERVEVALQAWEPTAEAGSPAPRGSSPGRNRSKGGGPCPPAPSPPSSSSRA